MSKNFKKILKNNLANIITYTRIISTLFVIGSTPFSKVFFISYTYAGVSDVLDGLIARKTNTTSDFGAKMDSMADLLFYVSMMLKIFPSLLEKLPLYDWVLIYSTLAVRIIMYAYVGITRHDFMSNHTYLNKLTGFGIFFVPYMIVTKFFVAYATCVCSIAVVAALYEIFLIYKQDKKH